VSRKKRPTPKPDFGVQTILHFGSDRGDEEYIVIIDHEATFEEQGSHCMSGFKLLSALQCDIPNCHLLPVDRPLRPAR
jgi:hypothetical protein